MKNLKFKGQKVTVTTDRIPEEDRDLDLYYYEIQHDDERTYLPILIRDEVDQHFWGTMYCEEPLEFNNGDFHALSEELGLKLAKALKLIEE